MRVPFSFRKGKVTSTKKFLKSDHQASDPQSRLIAAEFLKTIDRRFNFRTPLEQQKEEYKKWDFTIYFNDTPITVETERKLVWKSNDGSFPYDTIDVPTRKEHSEAALYIMFNNSFRVLAMTEMANVLNAERITKSTRRSNGDYITQGETFFHVPTSLFRFYVNQAGVWVKA